MSEIQTTAELLRLSHVSRWGIVQTAVPQTVAEHSWRVWCLTRQWADLASLTAEEKSWAEEMALLHDVPEIRTGDNPTPAKTPEMKSLLDKTEAEIYPPLSDLEERSTRRAKDFHKFCDTAESILFLEVNGLGRHAKDVQGLLTQQMTERLEKSCFSVWEREALMGAYRKTKAYT